MPTTQAHVGRSWIVRVCGVAAIAACTWLGTQTWGFDDEAPSEAAPAIGLRTVLPNEVPDSLDPADLDDILATASEDWQKKGNEIVELVIKLYEGDLPSVEAQEEVIGELKTKLSAVERALNGTLSDENKEALGELYGRLAPRVRLADAVLDTLTMDEEEDSSNASLCCIQQARRCTRRPATRYAWVRRGQQMDQMGVGRSPRRRR